MSKRKRGGGGRGRGGGGGGGWRVGKGNERQKGSL